MLEDLYRVSQQVGLKMNVDKTKIMSNSRVVPKRTGRRSIGRPPIRWTDDLVKVAGSRWMRASQERSSWRTLEEAYVQQWTSLG
jgi:hypothetical protein